jgi:RNA polymerase sigma-70 factor (ECF subfamily)
MLQFIPAGLRPLSDSTLLARLKRGDPGAMEHAVRTHRGSLFVIVERIVRDKWTAEDIVQDVFMRLFTHACTLQSAASLGGWLRRVARNLALTHLRDHRKSFTAKNAAPEAPPLPDEPLLQREQLNQVLCAVERLDEPFRTTFRVCALEGCDYETAARILGCNKTTVNTRMFRSWRRLRSMVRSA